MNARAHGRAHAVAHAVVSGSVKRTVHAKRREEIRKERKGREGTRPDRTTPEGKGPDRTRRFSSYLTSRCLQIQDSCCTSPDAPGHRLDLER